MADILDEIIMEDVASHCPVEFIEYHNCLSNPNKENLDCSKYQVTLSNCIKVNVPSVKKIIKNCGELMKIYESCIINNREAKTINQECLPILDQLRDCASKQLDGKLPINEMKAGSITNEVKK